MSTPRERPKPGPLGEPVDVRQTLDDFVELHISATVTWGLPRS